MNSQSNGRNQRPKGFKVKQALQLVVLLVFCIWLLYQIKNSNNENKDLTVNVNIKLNKEQISLGLGRKGDTGQSKNQNIKIRESREDQMEPEREYKESQKVDNLRELVKVQEIDEKNPKVALQHEENANGTITISFNDENGIPQDVKEGQRSNFYDENGDKGVTEDPKSELTNDGEEEKGKDFQDFRSVSVHQELEEVVDEKNMLQQDE